MRCPRCGELEDRVVDSRQREDGSQIRRRRECLECGARFTTYERVELVLPMVVKRDGRREPFSRDKILRGLRMACQKRPVSTDTLTRVVDQVELQLASTSEREVGADVIGGLLMAQLQDLDGVAWLRFASVYHSFDTIHEFLAAADDVGGETP